MRVVNWISFTSLQTTEIKLGQVRNQGSEPSTDASNNWDSHRILGRHRGRRPRNFPFLGSCFRVIVGEGTLFVDSLGYRGQEGTATEGGWCQWGGEVKFQLGQNPYIKLVLHALKHKVFSVNGILLGRLDDGSSTVDIIDAVPLSHSQIGLLPTLEIALIQVEEFFSADGLSVVGYFHANERYDDSELGKIAKKIGDHISRYFPQPAVLLLDNKKLEALWKGIHPEPVMQLYTKDASKGWRQAGIDASVQLTLREPSANTVLWDFIATEKYEEVIDFDDYLDDISKDWLNPGLFK